MKNVCITGYGAIGPIHADALKKTDNAKFYAVCDIDKDRNELAEKEYGVISYTDYDLMLKDENIHSVHVCTPHYLHFEMIKKALSAGKDVVCEKPITMTRAEYDKLLSLSGAEKTVCVFQNRMNPCILKLKEIAETGELGKIKGAKGILTWHRDMDYYNSGEWRGKWNTEGGGVLINQAVHTLDFFSYILGETESVRSRMENFALPEIEVEDTCMAHLKFKSGVKGVFFATNTYAETPATHFQVEFGKGTVSYMDNMLYLNNRLICEDIPGEIGKSYWGKGHQAVIKDFYDKGVHFSPFDVKNTMNTMFAIYESAKNDGKEIIL